MAVRVAWHASGTYDSTTSTGGSNGDLPNSRILLDSFCFSRVFVDAVSSLRPIDLCLDVNIYTRSNYSFRA
jgi:hypothetical protein